MLEPVNGTKLDGGNDYFDPSTANVTSMYRLFYWAVAFKQAIGDWNTAKVTNMDCMFGGTSWFLKKPSWYKWYK